MNKMKIVVGLGNPGEKYASTRHNIGWLALDEIAGAEGWKENRRFEALTKEAGDLLYIKPLTFMNESGRSVQKVLDYYKLSPKGIFARKKDTDLTDILTVIHDELDLDFGTSRISRDSQSAGHRGVQSIIDHLKTKAFTRVRLGIKNDLLRVHIPPEKFVLQPFRQEEKAKLKEIFDKIGPEAR